MKPDLTRALLRPLYLILVLGLMIAAFKVTLAWWRDEISLTEDGNWIWVSLFPLLLVVWWRYFSIFGCKEPACLLPNEKD
ncbi:MAG: hypothetical protein AAB278_06785 [Pseudomonadota bacterium]